MIELPTGVQQKIAHLGDEGARWLSELPDLITELQRRWSIAVVGTPLQGGSAAYVARAATLDGRDAVLKIAIPSQGNADQIRTIATAQGRGYVQLLAYDMQRHAMLLEVLGPLMAELALAPEQVIMSLCATIRQAWWLPPDPAAMPKQKRPNSLADWSTASVTSSAAHVRNGSPPERFGSPNGGPPPSIPTDASWCTGTPILLTPCRS